MATALDRDLRRLLDRAVRKARIVAEDGARKALTEIGLEDPKKPEGLLPAQIDLRNRLRAHARSLGDVMQADGAIRANRLVREIAYEHWHRAVFARFLSENNLLIDPDHQVAVSLAELEEIAKEDGRDLVELAADWAEPMLPQIFRKDDPVLALALPPETNAGITETVQGLPRAVFEADDSLGWLYQFWQADNKDAINRSEVKIGADELPAVTQLFTEDYMVLFLLENTLGAWWAGKILAADPALADRAKSEDELREKTSPPGYRWTYLRFIREPQKGETHEVATGPWRPAGGVLEGWPKETKDITVLDPCMGSGHFLVFALPILAAFRRAEEGLDERAAVKAVVGENLFGLEIDPRCTQIAAFAIALASWKRLGGPAALPPLNLACSGLAIGLGKAEFLKLSEKIAAKRGWQPITDLLGDGATPIEGAVVKREREGLSRLYDLFEKAPYLGSLIDPSRAGGDLFASAYDDLAGLLAEVLETGTANPETREIAVTAQGLVAAAKLLSRRYTLIATNVPYLTKGKQHETTKSFADLYYKEATSDIATVFIQRLLGLLDDFGTQAVVSPQNWLFLTSYSSLRRKLLVGKHINVAGVLGPAAFDDMNWWAAKTTLTIISSASPNIDSHTAFLDAAGTKIISQKSELLKTTKVVFVLQSDQLKGPDARIVPTGSGSASYLFEFATAFQGIATADYPRFGAFFWEVEDISDTWSVQQSTVLETHCYSGCEHILRWENGSGALSKSDEARVQGLEAIGRRGVCVSQMNRLPVTIYSGDFFDNNCSAVVPKNEEHALALWCFLSSDDYFNAIREIDQALKVTNASLTKVPFDLAAYQQIAADKYPDGLPKPYSNDPTQWLFDGHPRGSAGGNLSLDKTRNPRLLMPTAVRPGKAEHPLQVAVARLLGYRWPRQTGSSFMDCAAVYDPDEADRSGLVDLDGIVPLPALAGKPDGATRLRELIRAVWGSDYGEDTIRDLLVAEDASANDLSAWLADEFFEEHCELFHQTPFIWQVWDGVRGGFSALVNYHRLCGKNGAARRLLEKLRDTYLGEWIVGQRRALAGGEAGAEERLIAAEHLRTELTRIIEGEPPYDIFVRWKPLHRQAIGWEPDIDDGVRLNIRPFLTAKPRNARSKDACILRITPRVKKHAGADRGAEPKRDNEDFPWFYADEAHVGVENFTGGPEFKGRRYNDFHYTRGFKQRARDAKAPAVMAAS